MNKLSILIILIFSVAVSAVGQVDFGVRFGGSYSSLTQQFDGSYVSGGKAGFAIAGLADIPVYKRLSFRPSIAFVNQGGSYYSQPVMSGMSAFNRYKYYSLQFPLDIAYTFNMSDVRFSVFAGPTLDFSLFGKMRTNKNVVELEGDSEPQKEADLKKFDLGVNIGLAVEYNKFFFSIDVLCGTLDRRSVRRDGESKVFQNNVTFSLGYFFRKDK